MKRKYLIQHKEDKYKIEIELNILYWIWDEVKVGEETFIVYNREWVDSDL